MVMCTPEPGIQQPLRLHGQHNSSFYLQNPTQKVPLVHMYYGKQGSFYNCALKEVRKTESIHIHQVPPDGTLSREAPWLHPAGLIHLYNNQGDHSDTSALDPALLRVPWCKQAPQAQHLLTEVNY